ncbi:hypothetical protein J6590_105980, partial [Homalodisca vitripennis]
MVKLKVITQTRNVLMDIQDVKSCMHMCIVYWREHGLVCPPDVAAGSADIALIANIGENCFRG